MIGMLLIGLGLLAAAAYLLAAGLDLLPGRTTDIKARARLTREIEPEETVDRSSGADLIAGAKKPWVSEKQVMDLEKNLRLAGKPREMLPVLVKAKLAVPVLVAVFGLMTVMNRGPVAWLVLVIAVVIGYKAPDVFVRGRATEHQEELTRDLPDLLDQITIALDSGMSFEAAFARIGTNHTGPLGPQIARTVQDMAVGMPRRDAYLTLAGRNECEDLTRFVKSLIQAEEFGVPLANVVRLQAEEMREKRRQRASAAARVVPTKLLFPMMACFFPVLFIVILTPAVLNLGQSM